MAVRVVNVARLGRLIGFWNSCLPLVNTPLFAPATKNTVPTSSLKVAPPLPMLIVSFDHTGPHSTSPLLKKIVVDPMFSELDQ